MVDRAAEPRHLAAVKWNNFLQILRVRAVEEADARDEVWDAATVRSVTLAAKEAAGRDDARFLEGRASQLLAKSRVPALEASLRVPMAPGWMTGGGGIVAFITGWCFAAVGQESEINLLALPLIAILLWNAVVLLFSLFHGTGKYSESGRATWLGKMLDRFEPAPDQGAAVKTATAVQSRFRALAWPLVLRRAGFRFRAWLHLGAALLALGGVTGMYARGWSKEYRAVWESTLLGESGARTFFGVLFVPASKATGVTVPLDEVPQMRRGAETAAVKPGAALPWIHLYAATLGLFVIVPRVLFALLELSRAARVPVLELRHPGWLDYLAGVRASVEGDGVTVGVVVHALLIDDASCERWRHMARKRWREAGSAEYRHVTPGGEADFVSSWAPPAPRILLVFNMATTPETEVHRALAEGVLARLQQTNPAAALVLALDDTELKKRWSGFADSGVRFQGRTDAWHEVMRGLAVEWI